MTRDDHELGPMRRCRQCREWWPADREFYISEKSRSCRACVRENEHKRPTPLRPATHGSVADMEAKRARDRTRKKALRADPVFGDKMRARQREAWHRYYAKNRAAILETHRERYAAKLDRPVRENFGRPRVAA